MDLRHLRHLVRTIESTSISRAAQTLNMAQPSLSQSLRELEAELGAPLLYRLPNGIRATEAGLKVADRARAILRLVETLRQDISGGGAPISGEVLVGLPATMALHLTVPLVQVVRSDYPGIRLRVSEGMSGHIQEWVLSGRFDIAVLYTAEQVPGLSMEEIAREELCLISKRDPDTGEREIACSALGAFPLVLPGPGHGLRRTIEAGWRDRIHPFNVVVEVDSLPHLKRLAMDDGLHTILPAAACRDEIATGLLMARRIVDPPLRRPITLAASVNRPLTRAQELIRNIVKAMVLQAVG